MSRCTQCGATIEPASKSCEYCGAHVEASELELVLGFREAREKRIADEKRREADAARAAETAERNRAWKVMLSLLVVSVLGLGWGAWDQHRAEQGTTTMPAAASDYRGDNYQEVQTDLRAAGFTDIETTAVPDLKFGLLNKPGEVKEVSVNGRTNWEVESRFPTDAKIIIRYHTFPPRQ